MERLQQHGLAARRGAACVGGATFHVVHPGAAVLSAVGRQMIVAMGRCDRKRCTVQPSNRFDGATLHESCVFWWVGGS